MYTFRVPFALLCGRGSQEEEVAAEILKPDLPNGLEYKKAIVGYLWEIEKGLLSCFREIGHRNAQSQEDNPTKRHHQDLGHDSAFTVHP
ncbi:2208_t:CDS:2 [Funneliformis caledonium]|uniref:2208_t:CDS:1 n=1 Tax=Funneliformis caledonium TaxID=1117310 RepID=A0A9N9H8X6_9GLOM|nr:2208_t:CDS:2 [Funneliformis caledonium]